MKGIAFTLDSIFALAIAVASVSLLVYFHFTPQTPYATSYSETQAAIGYLISTNLSSLSSSVPMVSQMMQQEAASAEVWDQYQSNYSRNGYNPTGPSSPSLSYLYNSSFSITNGTIVADYGMVFFAAYNYLYAINSSSGSIVWEKNVYTNVTSTALYGGMLVYANGTDIVEINPRTLSTVWDQNLVSTEGPLTTPILIHGRQVIFGTASDNVYSLYASNGTIDWIFTLPDNPVSIASSGELLAIGTPDTVSLVSLSTSTGYPEELWSQSYSVVQGLAMNSSYIAFGQYENAVIEYLNGTIITNYPSGAEVYGAVINNGEIVFQNTESTFAFVNGKYLIWKYAPSFCSGNVACNPPPPPPPGKCKKGSGSLGGNGRQCIIVLNVPVSSKGTLYTVWPENYVLSQNISTGKTNWFSGIPSSYGVLSSSMSLAYGRLYTSAGTKLLAYGACPANNDPSLISEMASLYISNLGSCAEGLSSHSSISNYKLAVSSLANNGIVSSFNASTAFFDGINSLVETEPVYNNASALTIGAWVYPVIYNGNRTIISQGKNNQNFALRIINNTYDFVIFGIKDYTFGNVVPRIWAYVAVSYNYSSGNVTEYIDGQLAAKYASKSKINSGYPLYFGYSPNTAPPVYFDGFISNIQLYNESLTSNQIESLYKEGRYGIPNQSASLIGWWPLEGDTNDYSGSGYTGYALNVTYLPTNYTNPTFTGSFNINRQVLPISAENYSSGTSGLYNVSFYTWQ